MSTRTRIGSWAIFIWLGLARLALGAESPSTGGAAVVPLPSAEAIHADRWLEIDLYWFDRDHMEKSVGQFWDRCGPLFAGIDGWHGVILNIGWTTSYILDWRGDLNGRIPFPVGMTEENRYQVAGMLTGTTSERVQQWKERFSHPSSHEKHNYQPWTYGDVKALAEMLRQRAADRGLNGIRVGCLVLGWKTAYNGQVFPFAVRHPNIFLKGGSDNGIFDPFDPRVKLTHEDTAYGAYPAGIPEGLPLTEFFGDQWGSMSKATGLDALVLRDSMIGPVPYRRGGPYGQTASPDPAVDAQWTADTAALVRFTKQANPRALVIGYSGGASAVGEWRDGCVDLEAIAKEGFLDGWIDQSWAGAWNEVGVRSYTFWNSPDLGWTYQLGYVLVHAAQLADTKTRHYVLTDTFDAWESWDTIHTAPQRLRWGIWAYLHAAVKTPHGLKMPEGSYISWANQSDRLLSLADVDFVTKESNDAILDAEKTTEVLGPTLVYNRPALAWQQQHAPDTLMGEWIDEQGAALLKWGVPVLSITRGEYLPKVDADMLLVQTPVHLSANSNRALEDWAAAGKPLAIFGSLSTGVDPRLAALAGVSGGSVRPAGGLKAMADLGPDGGSLAAGVPSTFPLYQPALANAALPGTEVIYSVDGNPALTVRAEGASRVIFWDPADFLQRHRSGDVSMAARMGSIYPFVLAARTVASFLKGTGSPYVENIDATTPGTFVAWKGADGALRVLTADLEEGLSSAPRTPYELPIQLPEAWSHGVSWSTRWTGAQGRAGATLEVPLSLSRSEMYLLRGP